MKNYSLIKLCFFLFFFIGIFFIVGNVKAEETNWNVAVKCPGKITDTSSTYQVLVKTKDADDNFFTDDGYFGTWPNDGEFFCIKLPKTQTFLTFNEMVTYGLIDSGDSSADASRRFPVCFVAPDGRLAKGKWEDEFFKDKKAIEINYYLSNDPAAAGLHPYDPTGLGWRNCPEPNDSYSYRIEGAAHDYFIHYLFSEQGTDEGIEMPISIDDCHKSDEGVCKKNYAKQCFWYTGETLPNGFSCQSRQDITICKYLPQIYCGTEQGSYRCAWDKTASPPVCKDLVSGSIADRYPEPPSNWLFPRCAFDGSCDDSNFLLDTAVRLGNWLFTIIGSLAFLFFIYGGFTMILSFGNAEKVKKGQGILIAAVIGMAIAFGAFLLIKFLLTALNVSNDFIAPALRH